MISRRLIIRGQPKPAAGQHQNQATSGSQLNKRQSPQQQQHHHQQQQQQQQQTRQSQQQVASGKSASGRKSQLASQNKLMASSKEEHQLQMAQQADSSDGYAVANQYEDYGNQPTPARDYWRDEQVANASSGGAGYRHFDPYSIYSDEEDVWYSEERLFEDHLEEIFNKWRLLDDDIWCKLIIMERSRRIGKAYARVPIVTIDGSHELSYDGYKLALNGFDNPDRDAQTEECRKRIGKGIRIKMDNFGNILIKRLSKSNVYIKEWISVSSSSAGSSNSSSGPIRSMPSRQQLIKNQMAASAGAGSRNGLGSQANSNGTPSSSSGGSSMEPANDSAICDEVISAGGQLELDKIYVMFDMKKFQSNITQELCRPYPDKRKLEQQCFSIVGLARDSEEILNLPCWVMVINIVAIEMLNERFPLMTNHGRHDFPDHHALLHDNGRSRRATGSGKTAPNFVSIFETNNNGNNNDCDDRKDDNSKEEDPYSLPANASSSDMKSSIHDYGTGSGKNLAAHRKEEPCSSDCLTGYYEPGNNSKRIDLYSHKRDASRKSESMLTGDLRLRSKSNCNIYGQGLQRTSRELSRQFNPSSSHNNHHHHHHNNSSSIYSPGHMLVPPSADSVPPKLPPRDFVRKAKSKSSSNVRALDESTTAPASSARIFPKNSNNESIYSTGLQQTMGQSELANGKTRKTKKNRFLESLKAPLELAKSSSRSASVMGAPILHQSTDLAPNAGVPDEMANLKKNPAAKSRGFSSKPSAKNLKQLLGVKSSKTKDIASEENNYVHVETKNSSTKARGEVDSVVDSNEELIDDSQQVVLTNSSTDSYNDLDIPTPDYETDENIYALDEANYGRRASGFSSSAAHSKSNKFSQDRLLAANNGKNSKKLLKSSNKDDLYYSGFRAHVPQNIGSPVGASVAGTGAYRLNEAGTKSSMADDGKLVGNSRESSRYSIHANAKQFMGPKMSSRDLIYGSSTGLAPMTGAGSRYRSASMQRGYTRSQMAAVRSQSEMYQLETENPYAMSGRGALDLDSQGHYGVGGHRRRASSKILQSYGANLNAAGPIGSMDGPLHRVGSSMANSNYDIGRSSSGIYGNNSSSSSSDYAGWHPKMRKVNSSGYLNSIFKNHSAAPLDLFSTNNPLNNNNSINPATVADCNNINNNGKQPQQQQQLQRGYIATSKNLKPIRPSSNLSKHQPQQQKQQSTNTSLVTGPTYRSYDSSNDSEPSYTNSSDGLDIYDHIGAHARLNHHQFVGIQAAKMAQPTEVHVGEWENMYER